MRKACRKCFLDNGVESAGGRDRNFLNRALAYSAMAILDQAKPDWRYRFDKVYFVGLLNYIAWKGRAQAITEIALYTSEDHILTNNNYLQNLRGAA